MRVGQKQAGDCFGILDFTIPYQIDSIAKREAADIEEFVVLQFLADVGEGGGEVDVHLFGKEAGRDVKLGEELDMGRGDADLLAELADGAVQWVFARVKRAGGELEQIFAGGVAILTNEGDRVVLENRHDDRAAIVGDDLAFVFDALLADAVEADVENAALVDVCAGKGFGVWHLPNLPPQRCGGHRAGPSGRLPIFKYELRMANARPRCRGNETRGPRREFRLFGIE